MACEPSGPHDTGRLQHASLFHAFRLTESEEGDGSPARGSPRDDDPLLQGDRIYARDLGPARNRGLAGLFPARISYWLPLDGPPQPGVGPH